MKVSWLARYPVKSMGGETLACVEVEERGLVGDRVLAVFDVQRQVVASRKHPARWGMLAEATARHRGPGSVSIRLPDGERLSNAEDADAALTAWTGREVSLVDRPPTRTLERLDTPFDAAPGTVRTTPLALGAPGTLFDFAPVHVITAATISASGSATPWRFRPNIVVDGPALSAYEENAWVGRTLCIGTRLRLEVVVPTPRCVVPTLASATDDAAPEVLRRIAEQNRVDVFDLGVFPCAGVYARVAEGGHALRGDPVRLE